MKLDIYLQRKIADIIEEVYQQGYNDATYKAEEYLATKITANYDENDAFYKFMESEDNEY